jgi:U3 small nucleolar RNA-associated protein 16
MAATPASSAKKTVGKRELEALDTPTQAKRQRKTTVEFTRTLRSTPRKGGDAQESTEEAIDDTADATPRPDKSSPLAIRRRSSPKVVVEPSSSAKEDAPAQDGFHTPEPASSEAAFVTPFTSKKALEGSPTPKAAKSVTPAAAKKARGRPKKTPKEDVPEEIPSSTQESSAASPTAAAPKAHVRFGSEEPTMNAKGHTRYEAPAPLPTPAVDEDADSGSDSDEAPEMVSTSVAASKAAAAQADTSRALAAQSEKELKKRLAREQRIAAEQAAKRERDALKAEKAAARAKKAARLSSVAEIDDETAPIDIDRTSLPSLLPDSLLANLGDVRPPTPPPEARGRTEEELRREKLNRHIKFLEQSSKAPKDKRVGKHHVAVLGQQNRVLPPKVSKNTKGVREAWLKGRQGQQMKGKPRIGKTHRAKFGGGGFLRGED